ncbi:hypothetical protein HPB52_013794 [Rhipicephalus sanguineus]|uniref:Uncharacterized protein n=1 Tax=Rhipicephalus sanguineus TaxID=34632 RepID=A0A9D4PZZ0_RHISA|nr:hypothetical protein HPB52_013794 [Rhipicephalus sanguineus]
MHNFHTDLLEWGNTPRDDVLKPPKQRLRERQTRTLLPVPSSHLEHLTVPSSMVHGRLRDIRRKQRVYNRGARDLPPLSRGQEVTTYNTITRSWSPAVFLRPADKPRSAVMETEDGREICRTREHVRIMPPEEATATFHRIKKPQDLHKPYAAAQGNDANIAGTPQAERLRLVVGPERGRCSRAAPA